MRRPEFEQTPMPESVILEEPGVEVEPQEQLIPVNELDFKYLASTGLARRIGEEL